MQEIYLPKILIIAPPVHHREKAVCYNYDVIQGHIYIYIYFGVEETSEVGRYVYAPHCE